MRCRGMNSYQMLVNILDEKLGVVFLDDEQDDFIISDYVVDSIAFIQFIIAIEEEIGIELSDDFLDFELLSSAKGFAEKLDYFVETSGLLSMEVK